ncbi:Abi family protein [Ligilactobacillus salivarius]|uniref:Abi family protein n=1 Tax=Ligilactobacillus salivarius TaxID=1624 RepID=UPI0030F6D0CD
MKYNKSKEFKTLSSQCDIIVNKRKLKFPEFVNREESMRRLENELISKNYFDLINGLEDILNSSDSKHKFYGNYSLNQLLQLYKLNKNLRELILSQISEFEIKLKTTIAYHFASRYSNWNDYRKIKNYKKVTKSDSDDIFIATYGYSRRYRGENPQINQKRLFPFFITDKKLIMKLKRKKRYLSAYNGHPPIWVAIKSLDFGQLHTMFTLLNTDVASDVLANFNLKSIDRNKFESILFVINWLRNECAHFEMINNSRYHGKNQLSKELIEDLNLRTAKSRRNLTLFQTMCVLNSVQNFESDFSELISNSDIPQHLKKEYLKSIGYWRQSDWNISIDF